MGRGVKGCESERKNIFISIVIPTVYGITTMLSIWYGLLVLLYWSNPWRVGWCPFCRSIYVFDHKSRSVYVFANKKMAKVGFTVVQIREEACLLAPPVKGKRFPNLR
jgi:hypothetical protein